MTLCRRARSAGTRHTSPAQPLQWIRAGLPWWGQLPRMRRLPAAWRSTPACPWSSRVRCGAMPKTVSPAYAELIPGYEQALAFDHGAVSTITRPAMPRACHACASAAVTLAGSLTTGSTRLHLLVSAPHQLACLPAPVSRPSGCCTGSDDCTWRMHRLPSAEPVMSGEGHTGWLSAVAFHPQACTCAAVYCFRSRLRNCSSRCTSPTWGTITHTLGPV